MNEELKELREKVAPLLNPERSCYRKINYGGEEKAIKAAKEMNKKVDRINYHELEHYSCAICGGWHIGRVMTKEELKSYLEK